MSRLHARVARRRLCWLLGVAILGACGEGSWTLRVYNNSGDAVLVQVTSGAGVRTASLAPDTVGFVWRGDGTDDLQLTILDRSCEVLAAQAIRAPKSGLAVFDGPGRLDVVNESSGVVRDWDLLPDISACE